MSQGGSLFPVLFLLSLKEMEQAELGIQLSSDKTVGCMLFVDDFVGVSDSKES